MTEYDPDPGTWIELSVEVDHEAVEPVVELFARYGYNEGVVIEEPFTQDRDGDNVVVNTTRPFLVRTYVPRDSMTASALESIRTGLWHLGQLGATGELTVATLNEEDWANAWKQHYAPVRVGHRVVVRPPWRVYDAREDDVVVLLDPGMAFGTGTHPTTQVAMRLLESIDPKGKSVLDVGTGSAILAIAAAKLGATSVVGVDIDPVAVRQAHANVALNGVEDVVNVRVSGMSPGDAPEGMYDIVVANIIARVLTEISEEVAAVVAPNGWLVLSGIIDSKERTVEQRYRDLGFEIAERLQIEDWIGHRWRRV